MKKTFYTEASYALGLLIMAFAAAFTEKADFGMSMVVAPAYILHLKLSEFLPWFTFGVAEYAFQGMLVLVTVLVMRRFKLSYLFSFVTAWAASSSSTVSFLFLRNKNKNHRLT